nr:hypothetical protein CoNPh38_CDS0369 [Staphylococcus phage S-CoN_Ph38]
MVVSLELVNKVSILSFLLFRTLQIICGDSLTNFSNVESKSPL